eukprot:TRINITY_DN18225_c0_g2_i1.p1 TRINITY_DN18225_c0_g2~~TRINITY_DN18225_c0_g2_i1.p1  ORF type:complete len:125 (+),score=24.11 TRINITY_DN18225_c0_g2_i1:858-1232(+)
MVNGADSLSEEICDKYGQQLKTNAQAASLAPLPRQQLQSSLLKKGKLGTTVAIQSQLSNTFCDCKGDDVQQKKTERLGCKLPAARAGEGGRMLLADLLLHEQVSSDQNESAAECQMPDAGFPQG